MRRSDTARRAASSTAVAPAPDARGQQRRSASGSRSASNVSSSAWVNSSGSTRLTITAPSGTVDLGAQPGDELDRLRDRHLLGRRDDVDRGDRRIGEQLGRPTAVCAAQRADVDELADRVGRAELRDDVTGRGRVDDDEVEVGAALDRLAHLPHDLADREDLLHARRGGRDEVEHARERAEPADAPARAG